MSSPGLHSFHCHGSDWQSFLETQDWFPGTFHTPRLPASAFSQCIHEVEEVVHVFACLSLPLNPILHLSNTPFLAPVQIVDRISLSLSMILYTCTDRTFFFFFLHFLWRRIATNNDGHWPHGSQWRPLNDLGTLFCNGYRPIVYPRFVYLIFFCFVFPPTLDTASLKGSNRNAARSLGMRNDLRRIEHPFRLTQPNSFWRSHDMRHTG